MVRKVFMLQIVSMFAIYSGLAGQEINFIEDYVLAENRQEVLRQLVPGTEDYYYYSALYHQSRGEYEQVDTILAKWIKDHRETSRVQQIQNRQALLRFGVDPASAFALLKSRLNLNFNHQREIPTTERNLPFELDQSRIDVETLTRIALARHNDMSGFQPTGLEYVANKDLDIADRSHLLSRLRYPDYPNLTEIIIEDLQQPTRGFGEFQIHKNLTIAQLESCLNALPRLINENAFVNAYLAKLHPNDDVNWRSDSKVYRQYLNRLYKFSQRLNPVFNSLKACVLFRILELDHKEGDYQRDRFLEYLKLPRETHYINRDIIPIDRQRRSHVAKLNANFEKTIRLKPIQNDFPLVTAYLSHFLVKARNYDAFSPYIKNEVLENVFATVKLLHGVGDKERWAARLSKEQYQQLKDRVDLDFAATNQEFYQDGETVAINLLTKNIESLIVKVYEINELNYYRKFKREIDTNIALDGLVANSEKSYRYNEDPLLRKERKFEFPELVENGVYVIDFIGGGKSSRALIRRGRLFAIGKTTVAGQLFRIFDHNNQHVPKAEMWVAGNRYESSEDGWIQVPFSNQPGRQFAVLASGNFCSLQTIAQKREDYQLDAGIYVDRESLLFNQNATVMIRPSLRAGGQPASVNLLENAYLTITSVNQSGFSATKRVDDLELKDNQETVCQFVVPPRLKSITFQLNCDVENISQNEQQTLQVRRSFAVNQIDASDEIQDVHLLPTNKGYALEVRGKTGEARSQQAARIDLRHRDFVDRIYADLQSNDDGQILLGKLDGIVEIGVVIAGGSRRSWDIGGTTSATNQSVHWPFGEPVLVAAPNDVKAAVRGQISLLETRRGQFVADHFEKIRLEGRQVVVSDLEPGDYALRFKRSNQVVNISVAKGDVHSGVVLGDHRRSELRNLSPLVIEEIQSVDNKIKVQIANANKRTRVHIFASRYQPRFDAFLSMDRVKDALPWSQTISIRKSAYMAGRKLSDEYQYILNRRYEKKFPGNMLTRPSYLINPWSLRDTQNNVESLKRGEEFGTAGTDDDAMSASQKSQETDDSGDADFANLNFLKNQSVLIANVIPDEQGVIEIDQDKLKGLQYVRVIVADAVSAAQETIALSAKPIAIRDLRLANGLEPDKHFAQSKQIEILNRGQTLTVEDLVSGRYRYFDDLNDVFQLYLTLNPNTQLNKFKFLLSWSNKSPEEKQKLYSQYACHELNFYLFKKDKAFFEEVVRPHVAFKSEQALIDQFLTNQPLRRYLEEQWSFNKLNIFEKILLAQSSENNASNIIRNIDDLYYQTPVNREYFDSLYDQALLTGELSDFDALDESIELERDELPALGRELSRFKSPNQQPQTAAIAGLRGGGGGGGRGRRGVEIAGSPADQLSAGSNGVLSGDIDGKKPRRKYGLNEKKLELGVASKFAIPEPARSRNRVSRFAVDNFAYSQRLGELRKNAQVLYRRLPKTMEWIEQQYYQLPLEQQRPDLVAVNRFWKDYSLHTGGPFLSPHFSEAHRSLPEMMFALAVLDLPERAPEHQIEYVDSRMNLTAGGRMIAMHQQFRPVKFKPRNTSVLISENFFQKNDRYRQENGIRYDKFVSGQLYAHTLYGAQVVVTNPTSTPQAIDLLVQIPRGSVATSNSQETRSMQMQLDAFSTKTFEYFFYFPTAGVFTHYPAHVSRDDEVLAVADGFSFDVIDQPLELDKSSWAYVSQNGTDDEVIEFLRTKNVLQLKLSKIAFRMKDKTFFHRALNTLTNRYCYDHLLWSYAIRHRDKEAAQEYLRHEPRIANQVGLYLESELLDVEPYSRHWYQHREYSPLVNARAHQVGSQRQILNPVFHSQYHQLLQVLSYKGKLSSEDRLVVTYYLLLQDRIEEALGHFGKVDRSELNEELQFDYCDAYLDFYLENPESAARKASKWADYPVNAWRNRFQDILAQVEEIRGSKVAVVNKRDDAQQQTKAASETASFDFSVEAKRVKISAQAMEAMEVNYYEMDIENMFSNSPFEMKNLDRFSVIQPTHSDAVEMAGQAEKTIDLPNQFANKNVLVELRSGDQVKAKPYFANSLILQTVERYGQLQVMNASDSQPVTKAYVKVYSRRGNGQVKFHKDGYTDLRGRFDYVSQSNNPLDGITQYSILVLSPEHGAETRQVNAPAE